MELDEAVGELRAVRAELHEERFWRGWARKVAIAAVSLAFAVVIGVVIYVATVTSDTREAVTRTIPGLKQQVAEQQSQLDDAQAVLDQAVGHILRLCDLVEAAGGECGRIELKPPDKE